MLGATLPQIAFSSGFASRAKTSSYRGLTTLLPTHTRLGIIPYRQHVSSSRLRLFGGSRRMGGTPGACDLPFRPKVAALGVTESLVGEVARHLFLTVGSSKAELTTKPIDPPYLHPFLN
jgi:hypothetical protein